MPFQSEKQRRFMWSQHPEIAKKWAGEGKAYVKKSSGKNYSKNHVKLAMKMTDRKK